MIVADTNLLVYLFLPVSTPKLPSGSSERIRPGWSPSSGGASSRAYSPGTCARTCSPSRKRSRPSKSPRWPCGKGSTTARVVELVRRSSCSAYDCGFVALAEEHRAPLVTSDARVLRGFPDMAVAPASSLGRALHVEGTVEALGPGSPQEDR